jgi:hypothetical protein
LFNVLTFKFVKKENKVAGGEGLDASFLFVQRTIVLYLKFVSGAKALAANFIGSQFFYCIQK